MRKSRFTEQEIIGAVKQIEAGIPVGSQNSSAASDELIVGVGFVDQDASRQAYRW